MRTFCLVSFLAAGLTALTAAAGEPQLLRLTYHSARLEADRDYFVYLPRDFETKASWPVLLFLHGDGERGDAKGELGYVLTHGPLFEAWCQKRDLPFVMISPQLPLYDLAEVPFIKNRKPSEIPQRRADGLNPIRWNPRPTTLMDGQLAALSGRDLDADPRGWHLIADDLMGLIDTVLAQYRGDPRRVYVTGLSSGAYGTWSLAARHPDRIAAIAPVVGYGMPAWAGPLAKARLPIWVFAGGRDQAVPVKYFYPVLNELERLGHEAVRFTIEADMGHDAWIRVYGGRDLYDWLLMQAKDR